MEDGRRDVEQLSDQEFAAHVQHGQDVQDEHGHREQGGEHVERGVRRMDRSIVLRRLEYEIADGLEKLFHAGSIAHSAWKFKKTERLSENSRTAVQKHRSFVKKKSKKRFSKTGLCVKINHVCGLKGLSCVFTFHSRT